MERETKEPRLIPVSAIAILAFFAVSAFAALSTLWMEREKVFEIGEVTAPDFLRGKAAAALEDKFEDRLHGKKLATASWGILRYALFGVGNDGVIVGRDEWLFTREEFEHYPDGMKEEQARLDLVARIHDFLKSRGITLVVAVVPAKTRIYADALGDIPFPQEKQEGYRRFHTGLKKRGILAPDLLEPLAQAKKQGIQVFMRTDTHWSPEGAEIAAQAIAAEIAQACGAPDYDTAEYKTIRGKKKVYDGDLSAFIPTGALKEVIGPRSETYMKIKTAKADSDAAGGDLFGEQQIPVALVGTSYSFEKEWNFEGALKQALHTDVLNLAEEGKGPLEPMQSFLKNTDFGQTAPRFVIWEMPERFIQKTYADVKIEVPAPSGQKTQAATCTPATGSVAAREHRVSAKENK